MSIVDSIVPSADRQTYTWPDSVVATKSSPSDEKVGSAGDPGTCVFHSCSLPSADDAATNPKNVRLRATREKICISYVLQGKFVLTIWWAHRRFDGSTHSKRKSNETSR